MTDENTPPFDPELLELGGEALVVRLLDESGDLIRAAVGARGDLHDWLLHVLPEWGGFEVNYTHLLLSMMPELIQSLPDGAAGTLRRLLDLTRTVHRRLLLPRANGSQTSSRGYWIIATSV